MDTLIWSVVYPILKRSTHISVALVVEATISHTILAVIVSAVGMLTAQGYSMLLTPTATPMQLGSVFWGGGLQNVAIYNFCMVFTWDIIIFDKKNSFYSLESFIHTLCQTAEFICNKLF